VQHIQYDVEEVWKSTKDLGMEVTKSLWDAALRVFNRLIRD